MSRDENDAREAAQAHARALNERLDEVLATTAGLGLQRDRVWTRVRALKQKRQALRSRMDWRAGSGLVSVLGFCVGAVLARLGWELRPHLLPDERVLLGIAALATSIALSVSRTHGFRLGLWR
ncbi:MAG: hypothetical protein Q8S33_01195 [Myxococcales bacterium]|nr:hypothetical protein [Myxococcales bacterium]MDP3498908.1 hypothetical protein [Myxococcales bacterium]